MKAFASWEHPIGITKDDVLDFTMVQDLTVDKITEHDSTEKQTFLSGKKVKGTPARVTIRDPKTGAMSRIEGIIVKEADGIYVIAKEFVKSPVKKTAEVGADVLKGAEETAVETVEAVKRFDTEKTLGFSKKQLLVMVVTTLIVIKLLK
jgi:hypothetical protein